MGVTQEARSRLSVGEWSGAESPRKKANASSGESLCARSKAFTPLTRSGSLAWARGREMGRSEGEEAAVSAEKEWPETKHSRSLSGAPAGEAIGGEAGASAAIDSRLATIAEVAPNRAGPGFEFGAVSCQVKVVGRRAQPPIVRTQDAGVEPEGETPRRESRPRLSLVVERGGDPWLNQACPKGSILMRLLSRVCWV